jgi:hypothetical protein
MIKSKLKNIIYSISFLFRPITPVLVSFVFLVISSALLIFILLNLKESTKAYQVLLAVLTGITASLLISIMMELYNNYRFNVKRQRELRAFFRNISSYEINLSSIISSNTKYDSILGNGRTYAVFNQFNKIIPNLREALNNIDYLYRAEIEEIDNILCDYDDLIKIICISLLNKFMELLGDDVEDELNIESINDYPYLLRFLEREVSRYNKREKDSTFYEEASKELELIVEKAIFFDRSIFEGYFEVTDNRYKSTKSKVSKQEGNKIIDKNKRYDIHSNIISLACGNIDESMIKLQKRVAKEPYFCLLASCGEKINQ